MDCGSKRMCVKNGVGEKYEFRYFKCEVNKSVGKRGWTQMVVQKDFSYLGLQRRLYFLVLLIRVKFLRDSSLCNLVRHFCALEDDCRYDTTVLEE